LAWLPIVKKFARPTHGLTITHVFETQFHADFLSGHLELADGATSIPWRRCTQGLTDVSDLIGGYTAGAARGEHLRAG
jgi:hypothetical protein